jgi:excisionase family DNA binding protein
MRQAARKEAVTMSKVRRLAFTIDESAQSLGVSPDSLYRAIKRKDLRAIRLGGRWLVTPEELDRLLKAGRPSADAAA